MRYPVDVYTGKIQAYPEGKPSAIAKIRVDGELMLTDLGLEGDEQAEKKDPRRARQSAVSLSS